MCGTCKEQGHVSEDCPRRMMQPIRDLGSNVALSSKQVNLIETEMIGSSCSYPMVGVVTRSKVLEQIDVMGYKVEVIWLERHVPE